jgi:thiamine-phosphate pyrophosphorylase
MKKQIKGLQLIVDASPKAYVLACMAIEGGVDGIQFRHKGIFSQEVYLLACQLRELCHHFLLPFLINDRMDIALACEASGVHLGQQDMSIRSVREFLGSDFIIGATASNLDQAKNAEMEGADYIGFGSVFPTFSKLNIEPPIGIKALQHASQVIKIPLLAIGGINENNLVEVCQSGASGIAVISAIASAAKSQTKKLKNLMEMHGI